MVGRLGISLFILLSFFPSAAMAARPFAEVFSDVSQGTFARAANSVMRCDRARESAAQCNAIESTSGALQYNNNNTYTLWIDSDGVVDFDGNGTDDTYNSSSAQLPVPADGTVVWAGLYWHGNTRNTNLRTRVATGNTNQVRFRTPASSTYGTVTADWCSTLGDRYACYANVLGRMNVANAGGNYGVANVFAHTGEDDYVGGWELMVVYESDALPLRNLTVFHGHQTYGGGTQLNFLADDFLTPLMGVINAEVGFTIAEGDFGTSDAFNFRSQSAITPTTITSDLGNGSIEAFGVNVTTRNPAFRNTLGHDSDTFRVGNLMTNGDVEATIGLPGSAGEQNDLIKVDFAVDVYFPLVSSQKTVTDLNGGDVVVGDTLRYTVRVTNDPSAFDAAVRVSMTDVLDPALDFVPGSIRLATTVAGGPAVGAKTDVAGDDIASWDSTLRTLRVNLGAGATAALGGSIGVGESTSVTFDAVVLPSAANRRVRNSAIVTFEGATLAGRNRVRIATATSDDPATQARDDSTDVTPSPDPDGDGLGENDDDEDNDGILDIDEGFGVDVSKDSDGNGVVDYLDSGRPGFVDLDNNGVDDRFDADGDGIPNHLDLDSDGDGLFDLWEANGRALDTDGDGRIDITLDADADGVADVVDANQGGTALSLPDSDNDGLAEPYDDDDDNDGILTATELADAAVFGDDLDGDGIDPWYDIESDGDGINDADETQDIDADGVPDYLDPTQDFLTGPADGARSSTGTFVVTGRTEPGASVTIRFDDGGGVIATATVIADASGNFSSTFNGLADGNYTISATATDASGASFTQSLSVTVLTIFVEIDQPTDGTTTADSTPALVGRATPGAVVTLVIDEGTANAITFSTMANASGDWFVFAPSLADGAHTITARVDDGQGVMDEASVSITVDTTAPMLTVDAPIDGLYTSDTTPEIAGTSEPGQVVTIAIDGAVVGNTTADANGNWSFTPAVPLADGQHVIEASTADDVGNEIRVTLQITVDTEQPFVTISKPADGAVTGSTQPSISGQTEPGISVEVSIDGVVVGTTNADSNGSWTFVPSSPLAEGQHTVTVSATDDAGNTSAPVSSTFTVDTTIPFVSITTPANNSSTNSATPTVTGVADPGAMVSISVDGVDVGMATADANGDWSFTLPSALGEGSHTITASVNDGANTGSDSTTFEVDLTTPALIVSAPTNGQSVPGTTTVVGSSDPGATIVVTLPDGTNFTGVADSNGAFSIPIGPLDEGATTIVVTATDAAGNTTSEMVDVFVDTTVPVVKIDNPDDNSTKNDPLVRFEGTSSEANAEVVLILDGAELARVTSDANGAWNFTPTTALGEGLHTLEAVVVDAAGNVGRDVVDFIIDTRAPEVAITSPDENEVVTSARPVFNGTAPAGSTVEVFVDGAKIGEATADANGDWTFAVATDLADGGHRVTARVTDSAGNVGDDEIYFVVDTVLPFVNIEFPAEGSVTSNASVSVRGQAKPGATVEIFLDGVKVGETTANTTGAWSFDLGTLAEGTYTVQAEADGESDTTTFEIDFSAPAVAITTPTDGTLTASDRITVTGTAEPGATVEVLVDGVKVGETTADANGNWTFEVGPLADGDHDIEAVAFDAAGNRGSSGVIVVTVDTTPPDLTVENPSDGDSVAGGTTIRGTAEPGAKIEVFVDGVKVGETTADGNGDWEFQLDDPGEGEHEIVVVATDAAGNSAEVGPITVIGGSIVGNNGNGNNGNGNNGNGNNGNGGEQPENRFSRSYLAGGCTQAPESPADAGWALLLVAGLVFARRRRAGRNR